MIEGSPSDWYLEAERAHNANVVKVEQLIADARAMKDDRSSLGEKLNAAYWSGVEFGLRRALSVLNGNG